MTHEVIQIGLYVIFGIVLLPVYVMLVGWLTGRPRAVKPVALALGYMVAFLVAIIFSILVLDAALSVVR